MINSLTILIPTSPIPSHPSTAILDETVANIRKYTDARIILMIDGIHESLRNRTEDYRKYLHNIGGKINDRSYGDCIVRLFNDHTHQAEMTKTVLRDEVTTPLIFFVEHDTHIRGEIPFNEICDLVESSHDINYVRFNIFDRILPEHQYLMLNSIERNEIPLIRTIQWSQRPHIAKSDWYRDLLWTYFPEGKKTMIEDVMHGIVMEKHKHIKVDRFGLAIYAPPGNQLRSYHSDGRGGDEKIIEG